MGCAKSKSSIIKSVNYDNKPSNTQEDLPIITIDPTVMKNFTPMCRLNTNYPYIPNNMQVHSNTGESKLSEQSNANGFVNNSNTCFVAAALQCIIRIQPLKDYFLSNLYSKDLNNNRSDKEKEFLNSVAEIFIGYFQTNGSALDIERFLVQLEWVFPGYVKGEQADCQEFLIFFFDKLHSILNRANINQPAMKSGAKLKDDIERAWVEYLKKDKSIIVGKLNRYFSGPVGNSTNLQRL